MTKYEWEHELKKSIHRLPSDEIARVLDYYNEMFEDNIERGKSEREIIREFGNPVDVADKILSEYDGELLPDDVNTSNTFTPSVPKKPSEAERTHDDISGKHADDHFDEPAADTSVKDGACERKASKPDESEIQSETVKRDLKVTLFVVFNVITGFAFVFVAVALWIVLAAFTVSGVGMAVGGVYALIVSFGPMFTGAFGSGLAQLGTSIAVFGLGILVIVGSVKLMHIYGQATKTLFNGIFKVSKKERA